MTQTTTPGFTTTILHSDRQKPIEHGSIHKPIHSAVTFAYPSATEIAEVFQGKRPGFRYGRQGNPTVAALEEKLTRMEQGVGSIAFATGMAAIGALVQALLRAGDHVVSSSFLFGNTLSIWQTIAAQGIQVSQVDACEVANVAAAITPQTRMVFVETIANPRTQIADLVAIGDLCRDKGILFVVDGTMTTPYLFRAREVGAGLVMNSLTKSISGHGNVLGGALTDTGLYDWSHYPHIAPNFRHLAPQLQGLTHIRTKALRDFGAALSPDAAHQVAVGAETLALRMERCTRTAQALAELLEARPEVQAVYYPGLASHPQHQLARQLFKGFGALLSFELKPGYAPFVYLDALQLALNATHLGENRTLVLPVAQTIFFELGQERRQQIGIAEGLIRVSVGIEDTADVLADFTQGFAKLHAAS